MYAGIGLFIFSLAASLFLFATLKYQGRRSLLGPVSPLQRPFFWFIAIANFLATLGFVLLHQLDIAILGAIVLLVNMFVVSLYESKRKEK